MRTSHDHILVLEVHIETGKLIMNTTSWRKNRYHGEPDFIPLTYSDGIRERRPNRMADNNTFGRVNHEDWRTASRGGGSNDRMVKTECTRTRPNRILLVHGLEILAINCDCVFNLFCLYGNVTTVKVLRDGKVLVEMEDVESAKRCVINLHQLPLDDNHRMKVKYSKHSFIHDQIAFNTLPDGTPAHKIYSASKLNRFTDNGNCYDRRRVAAPSKILHFFNAPTDVCGLTVHKAVLDAIGCVDVINSITILPMKRMAKCSTGLIELKSIALAARTVLMANHMTLKSTKSKFPFLTKLCFSKWSEIQQTPAIDSAATLRFSSAPRMPWMLHKSEHPIPTTEFPISETTVVTGRGSGGRGAGDDSPWTLWAVQSEESAAAPATRTVNTDDASMFTTTSNDHRSDGHAAEQRHQRQQFPDSLMDMLRTRLCQSVVTTVGDGGDAIQIVDDNAPSSSASADGNHAPSSSASADGNHAPSSHVA
ncbi:RNA recognition motif domain [Cinara cedri]|uniref:RNA recognition motif domain n=1 Tax=Cinara cedri TaxID=506608 RepID=A0A5E4MWC7_9HEMI|nr:RNA recognition motif domain [Cinara cedri]